MWEFGLRKCLIYGFSQRSGPQKEAARRPEVVRKPPGRRDTDARGIPHYHAEPGGNAASYRF